MEVIHVKNLEMPASLESRFQKRDKDLKITTFHCNKEQEIVLVGCSNGTIVMWSKKGNITSYKLHQKETLISIRENSEEKKHKGAIMCLSYEFIESKCGDIISSTPYIFSSSVDATLKIWDLDGKEDKFKNIQTLVGHTGTVVSFKYLQQTDYLFTIATDRTIKIWKQDEAKYLLHYPWF